MSVSRTGRSRLLNRLVTLGMLYALSGLAHSQTTIVITDPAEGAAYTNAISQTNASAKSQAIAQFLQQYPNSVVKEAMLEQLTSLYQSLGDTSKVFETAQTLLTVDPDNLRALAFVVYQDTVLGITDSTQLHTAADLAIRGLHEAKPASMASTDFSNLVAKSAPIFYSALGRDATNKREFTAAVDYFSRELRSYSDSAQTTNGAALADTYYLGISYAQLVPPDLPAAIWYVTRALRFAPVKMQPGIQRAASSFYTRYHGSMDGFPDILHQVETSVDPPLSYKPTAAAPPPAPAIPAEIERAAQLFVWNDDFKTGNCHILPGARLELTASPNGYLLHFTAQMKTDRSLSGDVWHITWHFKDALGNTILTSDQADLPDGDHMHSQYGVYNVDHTDQLGPDSQPHIDDVINAVTSVESDNAC